MVGAYVLIALLVLLAVGNYRLSHSVLYPPFIFCSVWLLVILLYAADFVNLGRLHWNTLALVGTGAVLMSIGGKVAMLLPEDPFHIHLRSIHPRRSNWIRIVLLLLVGAGVALLARRTYLAAASGIGSAFLERARNGMSDVTDSSPSFLVYALPWAIFASVMFHAERRNWSAWLMTAIALVGSVLSTGRTNLLQLVSALTCVHLLLTNRLDLRAAIRFVRWPLVAFLLLWTGLIFTTKNTTVFGTTTVGETITLFLVGYIVGPVVGLDYVLAHPEQYLGAPNHTFKLFFSAVSSLHLIQYTPAPPFDEFAPMDFPTNVYTVYKFYYTDFGIAGVLIAITLIGFFQTILYRKACTKSIFGIYLFALSMYPLIMSFFDDQYYYSAFGVTINNFLFGLIYLLLSRLNLVWLPIRLNLAWLPSVRDPQTEPFK
jgi:oligosaccharide repeat unit polymerase